MNPYQTRSIKQMFNIYADENGRICKKDARVTKQLIAAELNRRVQHALRQLSEATEEDVAQIYKQFIEH